jgi:hypothetical protein
MPTFRTKKRSQNFQNQNFVLDLTAVVTFVKNTNYEVVRYAVSSCFLSVTYLLTYLLTPWLCYFENIGQFMSLV